jgi:hypothetical protein
VSDRRCEDVGVGDSTAMALAGAANLVAFGLVVVMWRRSRRRMLPVRTLHPSTRTPVRLRLVERDGSDRVSISVPAGAVRTTVDIISIRSGDADWSSEPLAAPFDLQPGHGAVLDPPLGSPATDVVVAWTVHHPDGERPGSRLFRLPPTREALAPLPPRTALLAGAWSSLLLGLVVAASAALAVAWLG